MIYQLTGVTQDYIWGGDDFIQQFLGLDKNYPKPIAEYWLGGHPKASSFYFSENSQDLSSQKILLSEQKPALPYLLKVLDVRLPLSIQLHPTRANAIKGFERENQLKIALDAYNRNYKDQNHKPEMMLALSDFYLLHGFKQPHLIEQSLSSRPNLALLYNLYQKLGLEEFYRHIMQADSDELNSLLAPQIAATLNDYNQQKLALTDPDYWLHFSMQSMDIKLDKLDAGLICFYLFNIVYLKKGELIYQGAGIPHAYLRGQNIELMACSDNVLRGGLTPKYIDVKELLANIDFTAVTPKIIQGMEKDQLYHQYNTPADDFIMAEIELEAGVPLIKNFTHDSILLVLSGEGSLDNNLVKQGQAWLIKANTSVKIKTNSSIHLVEATS